MNETDSADEADEDERMDNDNADGARSSVMR